MEYFEIEFSDHGDETKAYWICIKGVRQPTVEEASIFCSDDEETFGFPVWRVDPIDEVTARDCYDFSNETNWPVFGA
jgi:hypothetical protein